VALTCRSNDLLVNDTTTRIVTELLDRADTVEELAAAA
jgi:hypothetical protein